LLKITKAQAVGHLHFLWWWALDYAPNGDLSKSTDGEISIASEWIGEPKEMKVALKKSGFMDDNEHLHDWMDYAGRLIHKRQNTRERTRKRVARFRQRNA
jgi:hypothetical protein